jgi:hypothetical protein
MVRRMTYAAVPPATTVAPVPPSMWRMVTARVPGAGGAGGREPSLLDASV